MPGEPGFWRRRLPWPPTADDATTATTTPTAATAQRSHNVLARRDLSDGAVAGVVVGVVIFALLLAFCLYPVIVGCIKRRQRERRLHKQRLDAESAIAAGQGTTAHDGQPRLSSSESLKQSSSLNRGVEFDPTAVEQSQGVPNPDATLLDFAKYDAETAQGAVEYMPQDMVDDQPGVLKGTSEDYYRTSIPSSAFGMVDTPVTAESSMRTNSRASSLSHNIRHAFRRKSERNHTLDSVNSGVNGEQGATPLQRIITAEEPLAHSPTELSPTASPQPQSPALKPPPSATSRALSAEPPSSATLSAASSPRALLKSPSPPHNPAPGTVNPMDIMAPSTESEQWHRTEYQLYASSYESPPPATGLQPPAELDHLSPGSLSNQASSPSVQVSSPNDDTPEQPPTVSNDVEMGEDHLLHANNVNNLSNAGRHPSLPSEHSTPLPGPGFTDVSSQNTPSTQLDTPSPDSRNSSDFRHSASPGLTANHVPSPVKNQDGLYQCDEPGCTQSFDQPHKLKYVYTWT